MTLKILISCFFILVGLGLFLPLRLFKNSNLYPSTVKVTVENESLNFSFAISPKDQKETVGLAKEVALSLDKDSLNRLKPLLPKEVYLQFAEKEMSFMSTKNNLWQMFQDRVLPKPRIKRGVPDDRYEYTKGSGKLVINYLTDDFYHLEAQSPAVVLDDATSAGKLKVSPKIVEPIWKIAAKIDKIVINLTKWDLSGKIVLK